MKPLPMEWMTLLAADVRLLRKEAQTLKDAIDDLSPRVRSFHARAGLLRETGFAACVKAREESDDNMPPDWAYGLGVVYDDALELLEAYKALEGTAIASIAASVATDVNAAAIAAGAPSTLPHS